MINKFIIIFICAIVVLPLIIFKSKIGNKKLETILKVFAILLFLLAFIRCFLNDNFIWIINGGTYNEKYFKQTDIIQSLLRWGLLFSYIVIPCSVFFDVKTYKNWAIYFCLPIALISLFHYDTFLQYFTTPSGRAIMADPWFRHFEFSLELILIIATSVLLRFGLGHKLNIKSWKEWLCFVGLLPMALLIVIPVTLPQSIFGFTNIRMGIMSKENWLWILTIFILFFVLYFAFRFKNSEIRYSLCVFLAMYLFLHYNSIYLMDLIASRLPFQLCNLGAYLILLALLIKKQSFFNFVIIANVAGAIIACFVPDVEEGMLSYWNIHFYAEHTWVLLIPLLCVALRIFDRPTKKAIKHFFIGFTIYFVFCASAGIILNWFLYEPNHSFFNEVNYFYLFDDTVLSVLNILRYTRSYSWIKYGYSIYPAYMLTIYVLFSVFSLVVFYIYNYLCRVGDSFNELRKIRIELFAERKKNKTSKKYKLDYKPNNKNKENIC